MVEGSVRGGKTDGGRARLREAIRDGRFLAGTYLPSARDLARQLGISPTQLSYVTHSNAGEGLLFYGNTIIPFVDHFPKDTELYRIMTTKPEEQGQTENNA